MRRVLIVVGLILVLAAGGVLAYARLRPRPVLPLLRVLRDTDPNDAEASRALAEEITRVFTSEQRAELARLRDEARPRREERAAQGGGPGGPGGTPGMRSRADLRRRLLDRLIRRMEDLE